MQKIILIIGLMLSGNILQAQTNHAIMVLDARNGNPIIGATIKIKSTGAVLTTSQSGNAVIQASSADSLFIQCKGYKDRAISMENQSIAISIVMEPKPAVVASKPKKKKH